MSKESKEKEKEVHVKMPEHPAEKAVAGAATASSHLDPWPHYFMSAACALGGGYAYSQLKNPRAAAIAAGFAAAYAAAGRLIVTGNPLLGYDIGSLASAGLLVATAPRAYHTGEGYSVALATLGGISGVTNVLKSYQLRTGKPREIGFDVRDKR